MSKHFCPIKTIHQLTYLKQILEEEMHHDDMDLSRYAQMNLIDRVIKLIYDFKKDHPGLKKYHAKVSS
jgi:hypothetical protein